MISDSCNHLGAGTELDTIRKLLGTAWSTQQANRGKAHMTGRMPDVDVAIVGSGPYGLSIAAHLAAHGVDHRIFGRPMQAWQAHMPVGMFLKSEGFASNLSDPDGRLTLGAHCTEQGLEYGDYAVPVP